MNSQISWDKVHGTKAPDEVSWFRPHLEKSLWFVQHSAPGRVEKSVKRGAHVIIGTFGPEGPTKCSGLDIQRYDADSLHGEFGRRFRLIDTMSELHQIPSGSTQQFLYCSCVVE